MNLTQPSERFDTLGEAEDTLKHQGFKLVADTCNWIDEAGLIDAGVYAVEGAYGVSKFRIEYRTLKGKRGVMAGPTPAAATSRRRFLTNAAGVAAGGAVLALATSQPIAAASAPAAQLNESTLLKLEEMIFEQYEGACAFDDEIIRLSEIWTTESHRLYQEALSREVQTGTYLTPQERWALVTDIPECREHDRLTKLQEPFYVRMDALVKEMFAIPARTPEGRRAKATVLLGVIMGNDWRGVDEQTEYPERMARSLLIEFIGGEPGEMLRDQFA